MDNQIKTNNIISTPLITGNIGSCTSQEVSTISGRDNIWTVNKVNIITNSCTGEVTQYNTWEFSDLSCFCFVSIVCIFAIIFFAIISD